MRISDWSSDVCSSDLLAMLDIDVLHAWGMTELSPVGLVASPTPETLAQPREVQDALTLKQGRPTGIDAMIADDDGAELPRDGETAGRSEERRVGQEWVSTCRSRWSP